MIFGEDLRDIIHKHVHIGVMFSLAYPSGLSFKLRKRFIHSFALKNLLSNKMNKIVETSSCILC